jgi:hypothetical protein
MFDRPDADYLQDLMARYILDSLSQEEALYLQQQIHQDPQLQQVLTQLEYALGSLSSRPLSFTPQALGSSQPMMSASPPQAVPPTMSLPHRKTARRIIFGSGLAAATAIIASLPWLLSEHRINQSLLAISSEPQPVEPQDTWQNFQDLLTNHLNASYQLQSAGTPTAAETEYLMATLSNFLPNPQRIPLFRQDSAQLLGVGHYEYTFLRGIRLNYQLQGETIISVYQLRLDPKHTLPIPPSGRLYIESSMGSNLVLWQMHNLLYGIAAPLPLSELQNLIDRVEIQ